MFCTALLVMAALMPRDAMADCILSNPNSQGQHIDEVCWLQFGAVNTPYAPGYEENRSFNLPDGSSIEMVMRVSGTGTYAGPGGPRIESRQAPTWTGSNFSGNSGFYQLLTPNSAALYVQSGEANRLVLTLENIRLFSPAGLPVDHVPFEIIVADAERLNNSPNPGGERLDFGVVSGGSPWNTLEWLGNGGPDFGVSVTPIGGDTGASPPPSACNPGTFIDCLRLRGTSSGDASAIVLSSARDVSNPAIPFTVMGQIHSTAGQGYAVGVRWGGVRLNKALPSGRAHPDDQFIYEIENVVENVVQSATTTNATDAGTPSDYISGQTIMPGNALTLRELMAPGSSSTLAQYDRTISCSNPGNPGSSTVLPNDTFDPASPPVVDILELGDSIDCTFTNTPRLVALALSKSASETNVLAGETFTYSLDITNTGTHDATGAVFTDTLPAGMQATAGDVTCEVISGGAVCGPLGVSVSGTVDAGLVVTGNIASLPGSNVAPGGSAVRINLQVIAGGSGTQINTARVDLGGSDDTVTEQDTTDNEDTFDVIVDPGADLVMQKTVDEANPVVGDTVVFTLTLTNNGPSDAEAVLVTDQLPSGYTFVSSAASVGSYDDASGVWTVGDLANGDGATLTISATVNDTGEYRNTALVTSNTHDPDGSNDEDDAITEPLGLIDAVDDDYGPVNGYEGSPNVGVVSDNDTLNGAPIDLADSELTLVGALPPELTFDPATGVVGVLPGTPAGPYSFDYELCEVANPANCDTATVTVTVTPPDIVATDDDYGPANGFDGDTNVGVVGSNDTLNGDPIDLTEVVLTLTGALPPELSFDTSTGVVGVLPGTPAGPYSFDYELCEVANPTNCDTATVTVTVAAPDIVATDDNYGPVNGFDGDTNVGSVGSNDTLNGDSVDLTLVDLSLVGTLPPELTFDTGTGVVGVLPGTSAGPYNFDYEVCEIANPTNCDTATVTVTVGAPDIVATDDNYGPVNGFDGDANVGVVGDNDSLNGDPIVLSEVELSLVGALPPELTFDISTGVVGVLPGTPAGPYSFDYELCEVANPTNCDTATVTVTVGAPDILATDDNYGPVNGFDGDTNVGLVGSNDTLNGDPVDLTLVDLSLVGVLPPELTFDISTGVVGVLPGTPAGPYSFDYELCEVANPTNCDTATVTVTVGAPDILATDDNYGPVNGFDGDTNVGSVGGNDTLNGNPVDLALVDLSLIGALPPELTFDTSTGIVGVLPGTPAGPYSFDYQLCETANPGNCDTATVTVNVEAAEIVATDDTYGPVNGYDGNDNIGVVGDNDTLNGNPISLPEVEISLIGTLPPGLTFDPSTGIVGVPPGTPAGPYSFDYQLCEIANPTNCDTATVTVDVEAPEIVATDDTFGPVNGYVGNPDVGVVGSNDTLNGSPIDLAEVELSLVGGLPPQLTFAPGTGVVGVVPGTPAGPYSFEYQLCEIANPTNCDTATVTVDVEAPEIVATNDSFGPVNGYDGGDNIGVVGNNDTLNGSPISLPEIEISLIGTLPPGLTFDPSTGVVGVPPGTPAGPYSFDYQLCERANPTNCDTATVTVDVEAPELTATDDTFGPVNGYDGDDNIGVVGDNDTLNGSPITLPEIELSLIGNLPPGLTFDPSTGVVGVPPGTPAGPYSFDYQLCERANPSNCDTATVTVNVEAPELTATDDTFGPVNGYDGDDNIGVVGNNDTLNGNPISLPEVELSLIGNLPPGLTFDPSTGIVGVPPGTPAGPYSFEYQLCERANPANCDTATVTVNVEVPEIVATNDSFGPVNGYDGSDNIGVVGNNDTLNDNPITLPEVELSLAGTLPPQLSFDPETGVVGVLPGAPAGPYSFEYQLCERANPANCDIATVTLEVMAAVIEAVDDDYREEFVSGANGGVAGNVLGNDTLNGQSATLTNVSLSFLTATHSGLTLDESTGQILVAAGTPAGQYELNYRICDLLNPASCADAVVLVVINDDQLLTLQKQATPQQVRVGDLVRYTLTATNMADMALTDVILIDTPPPGFTLVEDSLQVTDRDGNSRLNGISPIRVEDLSVDAGARISISYFLRVGAGAAARGDYVNTAQLVLNGMPVSNQARATVRRSADPLFEDTRIWGTVFDDRDGDGWQDSASAGEVKVQGGFAAQAYVPNSTTVDRGEGPQPEADASSPLLHGLNLGELRGRRSTVEPVDSQRIVISQLLSEPRFTDDFVLTTAEGLTLRMNAAGQVEASQRGDMAKGLSAQDILVERNVYPAANGQVRVDYVITNRGIDERGIPGVRIGTVEGMLITTDAHGRFHLEGIDVSHIGRGRNFIMKIDEATLPAGSRSTTGNPLVKRITQGMPTRFDFGVQLPEREVASRSEIEVELGEVFFSPGSATIRAEQMGNLQSMLDAINRHRGGHVDIVGHADEEALGVRRAEALRAALLAGLTGDYGDALSVSIGRQIHLVGDGVRLGEVLFVTDKSDVRPELQPVVQSVAAVISQRLAAGQPTVGITITGHADRRGSLAYNEALGMRRARAVFDAIAQHLSAEERRRVLVEAEDTSTDQGRVN